MRSMRPFRTVFSPSTIRNASSAGLTSTCSIRHLAAPAGLPGCKGKTAARRKLFHLHPDGCQRGRTVQPATWRSSPAPSGRIDFFRIRESAASLSPTRGARRGRRRRIAPNRIPPPRRRRTAGPGDAAENTETGRHVIANSVTRMAVTGFTNRCGRGGPNVETVWPGTDAPGSGPGRPNESAVEKSFRSSSGQRLPIAGKQQPAGISGSPCAVRRPTIIFSRSRDAVRTFKA